MLTIVVYVVVTLVVAAGLFGLSLVVFGRSEVLPPVARDQTSRDVFPPRRARGAGELWATACENAYTGATVAS